ncbi:MAG: NADH-quinone oxidoreductase subunit G [Spirochaetes bacterium RBG_16_49_21]|nr:MAG: NADH-quinone oxidoreductase subunit G [Spirochaetes bacterium RBG_16_49_21]
MAIIYIENKPYQAPEGKNLLNACLSLGFNIPYFCWHPALGSVGACRQCAVKKYRDESDTRGQIVMSCMEQVAGGLRISIDDPEVREFRASIIEWLMANHPHDCPVCDEGGECHLQDMTVMAGHAYRRYRFKKRTYANQELGPFINHEMNRCIQCYRCVRFYRDYAGGRDLEVFSAHDHVYFGRHDHGTLESEFSGNLAEVCPTGVFTDKTLKKHYTRKWDLQSAASVCVHCGLGCNTLVAERYGSVRRILSRYNGAVNGYFLCDRGRFGYEFLSSAKRIRRAAKRNSASGAMEPADKKIILRSIKEIIAGGRVIGIGSPRASVESNFALRRLVGPDNFYSGMSAAEEELTALSIRIMKSGCASFPSLRETEKADAVFVLGEDVTNTAPMLALALRQSVKNRAAASLKKNRIPEWDNGSLCVIKDEEPGPLFVASLLPTRLDDAATRIFRGSPTQIARLGQAVAHAVNENLPAVSGLEQAVAKLAEEIARELTEASAPLVVSGAGCLSGPVMEAAANIAAALAAVNPRAGLFLALPESNSFGLGLLSGKPLDQAFQRAEKGEVRAAIILENDLYRRSEKKRVDRFREQCRHVIVLDFIDTATAAKAEIILPTAPFAEADGTLVNNEGRGQRFYRVMDPEEDCRPGWRMLAEIMEYAGIGDAGQWTTIDDIIAGLCAEEPELQGMREIAPPAEFRIYGQRVPRQPHRYSGRTAMKAHEDIHEHKPALDFDSPLTFSMEGFRSGPPPSLIPFYWSAGWNSVHALNKFQAEIGGPLRGGDPGIRMVGSSHKNFEYFKPAPVTPTPGGREYLLVPYFRIFGSEELSVLSPSIAGRIPGNLLLMNESDAKRIGAGNGSLVRVAVADAGASLAVKIDPGIPEGVAGYPAGMPGVEFMNLPAWGAITEGG